MKREGKNPEDEGKTEEELRKDYRDIAERRVRLGLVLTKIGEQNGLTVGQDEMNRAIQQEAMRFPGQQQQVFQYFANNPQALASIRAPLFEDKVVDFLSELVKVNDRSVTREILYLDPDDAAEKLKADEEQDEPLSGKPKSKKKKKD
jgi:trigger factor